MNEIVAYIRYSDHKQDDGFSIEYQTTEIKDFAEKNGFEIDKYYIDKAQTATKVAGREEFFSLVRSAKEKRIKVIIVYKLSRLFRNAYESSKYRKIFRENGIKLMSVTQAVDEDTSAGRLSTNIISSVDQYQSETISDHVKSSMREMARQGYYTGGTIRFGFDVEEVKNGSKKRKVFVPHPTESEIVKRIFEMYAEGFSLGMIRNILNEEGAKTKQGKMFSNSFIARIIEDDMYIGTLRFKTKDYDDIVAEGVVPGIVSKSLYESANEIKRSKSNNIAPSPRNTGRIYGLTGKIVCEHCGEHFTGHSINHKHKYHETEYQYYICRKRKVTKSCDNKYIRKEHLEDAVLNAIHKNILNDEKIKKIAKQVVEICYSSPTDLKRKIDEKLKEKAKLEKRISNLVDAFADGDLAKNIAQEKIANAESELKKVNRILYALREQEKNAITEEKVIKYMNGMLEKSNTSNDAVLKAVYDTFVESITLSAETITINLNGFASPLMPIGERHSITSTKVMNRP